MSNYSHEEVKELSDRFETYRKTFEEDLKQEPGDDEKRDALEDAEEAIETLSPILAVDDEDLGKYEDSLDELRASAEAMAEMLEK